MRRKYYLKNRNRFVVFLAIIFTIILFTGMIVNAGASSRNEPTYPAITVRDGDTLWEIASTYANNDDIRKYIFEIKELNQMENDTIYKGQTILLP